MNESGPFGYEYAIWEVSSWIDEPYFLFLARPWRFPI